MYKIENMVNKIHCADCLEILKDIPDKSIDLVITSPPYDNLRDYNEYTFDFKGIAKELFRVIKQGGIVVWVVGDATIDGSETGTSFRQALYFMEIGFNLHDTMIYQKNSYPFPPSNRYFGVFEYMFVLSKGTPNTNNLIRVPTIGRKQKPTASRQKNGSFKPTKYETGKESRIKENIWKYEVGFGKSSNDKLQFQHPATFPHKLAEDHIISWSNKGDLILDPFVGSGTTCLATEMLDRRWIGIDISEKYCEIARERIKNYQAQRKLF